MDGTTVTYLVAACAGAVGLVAFVGLILVPAVSSYTRLWQRIAAGFLSLYVLAALLAIGLLCGALVIYLWPRVI